MSNPPPSLLEICNPSLHPSSTESRFYSTKSTPDQLSPSGSSLSNSRVPLHIRMCCGLDRKKNKKRSEQSVQDKDMTASNIIPHSYIVVFKKSATPEICDTHCSWAHERHLQRCMHRVPNTVNLASTLDGVTHTYNFDNWRGYSGAFDDELKAEIEETDEVEWVEPDHRVYTKDTVSDSAALSWGLARISHKKKLSEETYKVYNYDSSAGEGVKVYIVSFPR